MQRTINNLYLEYKAHRLVGLKTFAERERLFKVYIQPAIGSKLVNKLTFEALDKFHVGMKETPFQANRVMTLVRSMFKFAQALRWLPPGYTAPAHVRLFPEPKRRRHMTPAEAPKLATAIRELEDRFPTQCAFLWLLIFTGARPGEIMAAKWGDIDDNTITLDKHKTDYKGTPRVITMPPEAMEKLTLIPEGHQESRIIQLTYEAMQRVWRIVRKSAKCSGLRIYDLRHTFATYALENGFTLDQIGEALDHSNAQTTKIYAEMSLRGRKKMANDVQLAILKDMQVVEAMGI
jgi:integrase